MKLRNKKTGEIIDLEEGHITDSGYGSSILLYPDAAINESYTYSSLAKLNEEWEDHKPAEPLIKDEKIRKAVRAWAEADGADGKIYLTIDENGSRFANKYGGYIEFAFQIDMEERLYTIAELCGEEEE